MKKLFIMTFILLQLSACSNTKEHQIDMVKPPVVQSNDQILNKCDRLILEAIPYKSHYHFIKEFNRCPEVANKDLASRYLASLIYTGDFSALNKHSLDKTVINTISKEKLLRTYMKQLQ